MKSSSISLIYSLLWLVAMALAVFLRETNYTLTFVVLSGVHIAAYNILVELEKLTLKGK